MAYQPDTRQRLQPAQRFFARLQSFDLECPKCGTVYQVRMPRGGHKTVNYDPWTARFRCTAKNCNGMYVLGILAWPIVATTRVASQPPEDQVPSPRQLGQMRKEGGGWWMPESEGQRYKRPRTTNLTTEEDRPDDDEE
jgi:hypothetical protein